MMRPLHKFHLTVFSLCLVAVTLCTSGFAQAQSAFDDPGSRNAAGSTGGDLVPVSEQVDGGEVTLGSSAQVVVLFRNEGVKPITVGAISLYPSSNVSASVGMNQCSKEPLEPGTVCAIALGIKGLQSGNYRIEMLMRHDGRAKLLTTTVTGSVATGTDDSQALVSDVEAIPQDIDFGSLSDSRPLIRSVVLRNITSKSIDIESVSIQSNPQSGFSLKTDCTKT